MADRGPIVVIGRPAVILTRRRLFAGTAALLAAPSIVRAASLMPVSVVDTAMLAGHYSVVPLAHGLQVGDVITFAFSIEQHHYSGTWRAVAMADSGPILPNV